MKAEKTINICGLALAIIMTLLVLGLAHIILTPAGQAKAAVGYATTNITCQTDALYQAGDTPQHLSWTALANQDNADYFIPTATTLSLGWYTQSNTYTGTYRYIKHAVIGVNMTSMTDVEIQSIKLNLYMKGYEKPGAREIYWSVYKASNPNSPGYVPQVGGFDLAKNTVGSQRLGPVLTTANATADQWCYIPLNQGGWYDLFTNPDVNGMVWLQVSTLYEMSDVAPGWENGLVYTIEYSSSDAGATYKPRLAVTYADEAVPRTVTPYTNAATDNLTNGTEVATNITWQTPRCSYADETLILKVNGDSGAPLELTLVDDAGTVLASQDDSIRVDGAYYWNIPAMSSSYSGWVRAIESNYNLYSAWGRIEPAPDSTQALFHTYAAGTGYPQYDETFNTYVATRGGLMYVHWKTNMEDADMGNYSFRLWSNSDNVSGVWLNQTMTWLNTNYYDCSGNHTWMAHWRYMVLSPAYVGAGVNTRDGLVYDLAKDYTLGNAGFITAIIYDDTGLTALADCHSAYYYVQSAADGVAISLDRTNYDAGADMAATITIGDRCKVGTKLSLLKVQLIDDSGAVASTEYTEVKDGTNTIDLVAPTAEGNYQARFTCYDTTASPYYSYVRDADFGVGAGYGPGGGGPGGGEAAGWQEWIQNFLAEKGLDNEGGHWLVILIVCLVIFGFGWATKSRPGMIAACLLIILVIMGALIMKWLNVWFFVLLCIGAGLTIYGFMKHGRKQGSDEE